MMIGQKRSRRNAIWDVIGIVCIIVLAILFTRSTMLNNRSELATKVLQDTLRVYEDREGFIRGSILTVQTKNSKLLLTTKSLESDVIRLQEAVKKYEKEGFSGKPGSSVSVADIGTDIDIKVPTTFVTEDEEPNSPVYETEFDLGGWVFGDIIAAEDSTQIKLRVKNEFDVIIDYEKQGFLGTKKPLPISEIVSRNPYSTINTFRTFQVSQPPGVNLVIGPSIGYGLGQSGSSVFVGVTATYPLFKLRL